MSFDTDKDRHPIPAEIIKRFSRLETSGDCHDLVISGYLDAMIESGYMDEQSIQDVKQFQEMEKQATASPWVSSLSASHQEPSKKIASLREGMKTIPDMIEEARQEKEQEKQEKKQREALENPPVPESKFIDSPGKYSELLQEADIAYRQKYKRQVTMRALFVNMPELCPHLVNDLDGIGSEAKLIVKGEMDLSWRQFRDKYFKKHFPDLS